MSDGLAQLSQAAAPEGYFAPGVTDQNGNQDPDSLVGNSVSSDMYSTNPAFYQNAANAAAAQAGNYYSQGQQFQNNGPAAPTIYNPSGAQSRQQLQGLNNSYNAQNASLQATANGQGPNMGAAVSAQGQNQNIQQQMQSQAGARGGGSLSSYLAGANASNPTALATNSAGATQGQINTAQQGLSSSLYNQGQMNMQQYGTESQAAQQQAALQEAQNQQNQQQALGLYGASLGEQNTYLNAVTGYDTQAQATQKLATENQAQKDSETQQIIGGTLGAATGLASAVK